MADVSLQLSQDVIRPIIEAKIKAAIIESFGKQELVLGAMIDRVLATKVNSSGETSGYSSDTPFIDWVVRSAIRDSVKNAIKEFIELEKPKIRSVVAKELRKKTGSIAESFVSSLISQSIGDWQYGVTVNLSKSKD